MEGLELKAPGATFSCAPRLPCASHLPPPLHSTRTSRQSIRIPPPLFNQFLQTVWIISRCLNVLAVNFSTIDTNGLPARPARCSFWSGFARSRTGHRKHILKDPTYNTSIFPRKPLDTIWKSSGHASDKIWRVSTERYCSRESESSVNCMARHTILPPRMAALSTKKRPTP